MSSHNSKITSNRAPSPSGYKFPPQKVAWLTRELLLYANSIGCTKDELHFLYESHPQFAAFPTYPVVLPFKLDDLEVSDTLGRIKQLQNVPGSPIIDVSRYVDAERRLTQLKPLPITTSGRSFELRQTCRGVYDKDSHTVQEFETLLVDADSNEVYSKFLNIGIAIGQGGWGGPKGPPPVRYSPPRGRKADFQKEINLSKEEALLYRLNGDYSPHSVDPAEAIRTGFPRPILHGMATWSRTAHAILQTLCGSDPSRMREFGARFTGLVFPGDRLLLEMWLQGPRKYTAEDMQDKEDIDTERQDDWEEVRFQVTARKTVVLDDGCAILNLGRLCKQSICNANL